MCFWLFGINLIWVFSSILLILIWQQGEKCRSFSIPAAIFELQYLIWWVWLIDLVNWTLRTATAECTVVQSGLWPRGLRSHALEQLSEKTKTSSLENSACHISLLLHIRCNPASHSTFAFQFSGFDGFPVLLYARFVLFRLQLIKLKEANLDFLPGILYYR